MFHVEHSAGRVARCSVESGARSGSRCSAPGHFPVDCLSIESLKLIMAWIESYMRRTAFPRDRQKANPRTSRPFGAATGGLEHDGDERRREKSRGARWCDVPERLIRRLALSR